jgi:hypothetical protein
MQSNFLALHQVTFVKEALNQLKKHGIHWTLITYEAFRFFNYKWPGSLIE